MTTVLNVKADNRDIYCMEVKSFYDNLIENLRYFIKNNAKEIDKKAKFSEKEISDFVLYNYTNSNNRKMFKAELSKIKNETDKLNAQLSVLQLNQIRKRLSDAIDKFSDTFQTEYNKKCAAINKHDPDMLTPFKQGVFNKIMYEVTEDFKNEALPDRYKLKFSFDETALKI